MNRALFVAAIPAVLLGACEGGFTGPSQNGTPVARVIIAPDSVALPRGEMMRLEAVLVDASGNVLDGRAIQWGSSDTVRVKVASTGVITASSAGSSLVIARSEGKADSVKVIVTD